MPMLKAFDKVKTGGMFLKFHGSMLMAFPQVAIGRINIAMHHSANLIESKSLKLYFNSMNFTQVELYKKPLMQPLKKIYLHAANAPVTLIYFMLMI